MIFCMLALRNYKLWTVCPTWKNSGPSYYVGQNTTPSQEPESPICLRSCPYLRLRYGWVSLSSQSRHRRESEWNLRVPLKLGHRLGKSSTLKMIQEQALVAMWLSSPSKQDKLKRNDGARLSEDRKQERGSTAGCCPSPRVLTLAQIHSPYLCD